MRALILNDRPWHYECYIHIIDFCIHNNIELNIFEIFEDPYGYKQFYLSYFKDKIKFIKGIDVKSDNSFGSQYNLIFIVSNNFLPKNCKWQHRLCTKEKIKVVQYFSSLVSRVKKNNKMDKKIIVISHTPELRNKLSNNIDIRPFPDSNKPYAHACAALISPQDKKSILKSQDHINIFICAGENNFDANIAISKLLSLSDKIKVFWCHQNITIEKYSKYSRLEIFKNVTQLEFNNL